MGLIKDQEHDDDEPFADSSLSVNEVAALIVVGDERVVDIPKVPLRNNRLTLALVRYQGLLTSS